MALLYWIPALLIAYLFTKWSRAPAAERTSPRHLRFIWLVALCVPFWDVIPGNAVFVFYCVRDGGVEVFAPPGRYLSVKDPLVKLEGTGWSRSDFFGIARLRDNYVNKQTGELIARATSFMQYGGNLGFYKPWMGGDCFANHAASARQINDLLKGDRLDAN